MASRSYQLVCRNIHRLSNQLVNVQRREFHHNWALCRSAKRSDRTRFDALGHSRQRTFASKDGVGKSSEPNYTPVYIAVGAVAGVGLLYYLKSSSDSTSKSAHTANKSTAAKLVDHLPEDVPFLIIGGGTAGFAAFRAIRSTDPNARVLVVTDEDRRPYMRPPLSKELWFNPPELAKELIFKQWSGDDKSLYFEKEEFFLPLEQFHTREHGGVFLVAGHKVVKIDATEQKAYLDNGQVIKYQKCLLATGGRPKNLDVLEKASDFVKSRTILYRNADDFLRVFDLFEKSKSITIIGGGFLGSELACCMGRRSKNLELEVKIQQLVPEKGILAKVLPDYLSQWSSQKVTNEGVTVKTDVKITAAEEKNGLVRLSLSDGTTMETEHLIVAVGLQPNVDLAKTSSLEIDPIGGGYLVNAELEARSNLWVAGDASSFYDVLLGRRRVEHHDHAIVSGRLAGQNMAAEPSKRKPYVHQSMFWSDVGPDIAFEATGLVDSNLKTVAVFCKDKPLPFKKENELVVENPEKPAEVSKDLKSPREILELSNLRPNNLDDLYRRGVIFYLKEDKVVGILLWNLFNRLRIARNILRENKSYDDLSEVAKLFELYEDDEEE